MNPKYGNRVPNPPDVSDEAIENCTREIREIACHYGWTDHELEAEMKDVAAFIASEIGGKDE